jgi:hypothetical protein
MRPRWASGLIELLVVIALITGLAALLVTVSPPGFHAGGP